MFNNAEDIDFGDENYGIDDQLDGMDGPPMTSTDSAENTEPTLSNNENNISSTTGTAAFEAELKQMMKVVNDQLEHELVQTKTAVKRILKELVAYQTVSSEISAEWAPILEAEHQEASRLDELQSEVLGSVNMIQPRQS